MIGNEIVNDLPPAERGIAMVFQSYALYPHMTVKDNMGFGLKLAKVDPKAAEERVQNAARILQITHLLDRKPKQLSGGQRQRVAIGRAIVRDPRVFLFDEPLSNLDAALRVQMRIEIAKLHHSLDATMIYVTHDQVEAMTLADRIVVLDAGNVRQFGAPLELYQHPHNKFVAGFIGSPKMNFLPCTTDGDRVTLPNGCDPRRHRPQIRPPPHRARHPPRAPPRRRHRRRRDRGRGHHHRAPGGRELHVRGHRPGGAAGGEGGGGGAGEAWGARKDWDPRSGDVSVWGGWKLHRARTVSLRDGSMGHSVQNLGTHRSYYKLLMYIDAIIFLLLPLMDPNSDHLTFLTG